LITSARINYVALTFIWVANRSKT